MRSVRAVLETLTRFAHGSRIFGRDHPKVVEAADQAMRAFQQSTSVRWPIELAVGRDAFTCEGSLVEAGSDVGCLANAMYESSIAVFRLRRAPRTDELGEMAEWIASLPQQRGGTLPGCARGATGVFEVIPVSASPLRFAAAPQAAPEGAKADWQSLCASLMAQSNEPAVGAAAQDLRARLEESDPSHRSTATTLLGAVLEADADTGPNAHRARDPRIGAALASLTPELRASMLSVCAARGSAWLARHADQVPVAELVSALRSQDRPGHAMPASTVLLMHRLIGSTTLSDEARRAVAECERSWSTEASGAAALLHGDSMIDPIPEDYEAELRRAATRFTERAGGTAGAFEFEPVALRVCELALELLAAKTPDELTADHLHLLLERVAMLSESGRMDLLMAAGETAGRLMTSSIEAVARHAEQLASAAHAPAHVGHMVRSLGECEESIASLARLLVIAPEPVITTLASKLSDLEIGLEHAHIRAVAAAVDRDDLRAVIAEAVRGPAPWINGLIDFLSACPDEVILVAGEPLFRTRNPEVRARTVRVLDGRLADWPPRLTELALSHPDAGIVEIGRKRLARDPGGCRPETLGALLTGSLTGEMPDAETALVVIDALISQGAVGVDRGAAVLSRLAHGCNRRRAQTCRMLAIALEPFKDRPTVSSALRAWRVSAFGVLTGFLSHHHPERRAA